MKWIGTAKNRMDRMRKELQIRFLSNDHKKNNGCVQ